MESYFKKHHQEFFSIVKRTNIRKREELESYVHALLDIEESMEKIYDLYAKKIIEIKGETESIQDVLWDIREEFRHIEYHINDGKLTE